MTEKIKILLVDDERNAREVMAQLLSDYFPDAEVVGGSSDVESAYRDVMALKPDLVFLDIQMPKANGFSLLKRFAEVPFEVIFVTSFDQFAINAIKFSALDYLLKPVEIPDLRSAMEKASKVIHEKRNSRLQIVNLLQNLEDSSVQSVAVHSGDKVKFIPSSDIVYIEADGRYCHIFLESDSYVTARYLKDFEDYFANGTFIRIGKSHLINASKIVSYSKGEPCIIELKTGKCFEVSRRKKQEVLEKLASR